MGTFTNSEDQMKSRIMWHFIRVYTVKVKKDIQTKITISFKNYNVTPLVIYNGPFQVYCIKTRRKNPLVYIVKGLIS